MRRGPRIGTALKGLLAPVVFAAFFALSLSLVGPPAAADQTDPRLDELFEKLQSAPDLEAAQPLDREIWRIWLEHPDTRTREVTLIGTSFMSGGQPALAEIAFNEAIRRHPDFAEAWNKRATLRYLTGDLDGSVADCAHVLKLEPRHYGAMSGLGQIEMRLKHWQGAARWFERALAVNPHMPGVEALLETARKKAAGEET